MINKLISTSSLALVLACLLLQACGLKGGLYLEPAVAEAPAVEPTELVQPEANSVANTETETETSQLTSPTDDVAPE